MGRNNNRQHRLIEFALMIENPSLPIIWYYGRSIEFLDPGNKDVPELSLLITLGLLILLSFEILLHLSSEYLKIDLTFKNLSSIMTLYI